MMSIFGAYASSVIFLLLLWCVYRVVGKTWKCGRLYEGADGRPSSSKFQFFLWTIVVLFAYVSIFAARYGTPQQQAVNQIPRNVLIAMGLSVTTLVAAKGITSSYVSSGQLQKPANQGKGGLFTDDDGYSDLSKIQMLAWTLVALAVYVLGTHSM